MNSHKYFIIAMFLFSCGRSHKEEIHEAPTNNIEFPLKNPKILTSWSDSLAAVMLDSSMRVKWSDKIMRRSSLYSSGYLAKFNKVNNFNVFAIQTRADDWGKSFLITTNPNLDLVDYVFITHDIGDAAQDENGNTIVTGAKAMANFVNDSIFIRTRLNETIYFYGQAEEYVEKDSVLETFLITSQGKFKLLKADSVRIIK